MLTTIAIVLPVLALVAPWQAVWRICLLFFYTLITYLQFFPQNDDVGNGFVYAFGLMIVTGYFLFLGILLLMRGLIFYSRLADSNQQESKTLSIDAILLGYCGILSSVYVLKFLAFGFSTFPHGFIIHGLLVLIFIGFFMGSIHCKNFDKHASSFFIGLTLSLTLFTFLGIFYGYFVISSSENKAKGNPYCVVLNKQRREVSSIEELTFFTMDKNRRDHHAIMLVDNEGIIEPYQWSYFKMDFLKGVVNWDNENSPSVPCKPIKNFLYKPSPKKNSESVDIYFKKVFIKIDSSYNPETSGNYISISAIAPEFRPVQREKFTSYSSMQIRNGDWINNLLKDKSLENSIDLAIVIPPPLTEDLYYLRDDKNQTISVMNCYDSRKPNIACQHWFYRDGKLYSFDHSRELIPHWAEMEDRLYSLFKSFGVQE